MNFIRIKEITNKTEGGNKILCQKLKFKSTFNWLVSQSIPLSLSCLSRLMGMPFNYLLQYDSNTIIEINF